MEDEDIKLLKAHIRDLDRQAYERDITRNTGFLSLSEQNAFHDTECELRAVHILAGGYEDHERAMVIWPASYDKDCVPGIIAVIRVTPVNLKYSEKLTHRDYLGALMNLGIRRDRIGDILTGESGGYIICCAETADIICNELDRIRNTSVCCIRTDNESPDIRRKYIELTVNAPSQRLDAVIAAVYRLSRTGAAQLIESKEVFIDGREAAGCGIKLKEGSRISVRGKGKFIFDGINGETRKGRLNLGIRVFT